MPVHANWDDVADSDVLPKGYYQMELTGYKFGFTQSGILKVNLTWTAQEPEAMSGRRFFETFSLGTEDAPTEFVPSTYGARELKRTFKQLHTAFDPDVESMLEAAIGTSAILFLDQETYNNRLQNKCVGRYALGDREPAIADAPAAAAPVTPLAGRPSARRASAARSA